MTTASANAASPQTRPAAPAYRIIYNWDGAPHFYSEYPQTMEQFLEKVYAPLADTQVDALFWCLGTHEATWLSENIPVVGDTVDRVYGTVRSMRDTENLRAMLERGEDPYAAMVDRGTRAWHRRVEFHPHERQPLLGYRQPGGYANFQIAGPHPHAKAAP